MKQTKKHIIAIGILLVALVASVSNVYADKNKTDKSKYQKIVDNHEYSVSIKTNNTNTVYYGQKKGKVLSCKKVIDGKSYEYTCAISDENSYYMLPLDETRCVFYVAGMPKTKYILFENMTTKNGTLNFSISYCDKTIAYCSIKLPQGTRVFEELLPLSFDDKNSVSKELQFIKTIAICIFSEISDSINDSDKIMAALCYKNMKKNSEKGIKHSIIYYDMYHSKGHENCSFDCSK